MRYPPYCKLLHRTSKENVFQLRKIVKTELSKAYAIYNPLLILTSPAEVSFFLLRAMEILKINIIR